MCDRCNPDKLNLLIQQKVIQQAKQKFDVPICAIGGLTVENSQLVIDAGASLCAVISDILGRSTAEIPARVAAWAQLFA